MIVESALVSATNNDLLVGGRLNAIPYNGVLTLQFSVDTATSTNNFVLNIQKPNGDVPIDSQLLTACGTVGVIDSRTMFEVAFEATQGGHFNVSLTKAGTAIAVYRAILRP